MENFSQNGIFEKFLPKSIICDDSILFAEHLLYGTNGPIEDLRTIIAERNINPSDLNFGLFIYTEKLMKETPKKMHYATLERMVVWVCQHPPIEKIWAYFKVKYASNPLWKDGVWNLLYENKIPFDNKTVVPLELDHERTQRFSMQVMDYITKDWFQLMYTNPEFQSRMKNILNRICERYANQIQILE